MQFYDEQSRCTTIIRGYFEAQFRNQWFIGELAPLDSVAKFY